MRELQRHVDVFADNVESQNSANQVRKLFRNM
jgi:hypothetical protein